VAQPFLPDDARLAALRDELPALSAGIYLDAGSAGPMPSVAAAAMADLAAWEVGTGRASLGFAEALLDRLEEARAAVAAVMTADVDEVAITASAQQAVASAIWALPWAPGDRVLAVAGAHAEALDSVLTLRDRGVDLALVDIDQGVESELIETFDRQIAPGTRLVAVPHVSAATGRRLPIAAIAALARERGAIVLVDGDQSAGAIPIDVPSLGVDLYAVPGHRWLLGPEGIAALWVAPRFLDHVDQAAVRPGSLGAGQDASPAGSPRDARRFDAAGLYKPAIVGWARSLGWLTMHVGLPWAHEQAAAKAGATADRLARIPGVEVLTPRDRMATLVTFRVTGWSAERAVEELGARCFAVVAVIASHDAVRISVAWYSSTAELERFTATVALLAAHTPGTLPPRRTLEVVSGA
jgi:L-cysteine/cystine lyase